jgi:hypothetical protein
MKLLGIISVDVDITDQLLIKYNWTVHQLFIDLEKAYDSVRRNVWYNILTEFGIPMKLG